MIDTGYLYIAQADLYDRVAALSEANVHVAT